MRYISTRGQAPARDFAGVLLAGLAEDGGLFMPETWPVFSPTDWRAMRGLTYPDLAARVMAPFVDGSIAYETLTKICHDAYAGFDHPAVVPLAQLETHLFAQELFHGPTLAFKDMALQVLGHLFEHVLSERNERVTIVGATSGDTGSAAIEACAGRERIDIVILHPHERTSLVPVSYTHLRFLNPDLGLINLDDPMPLYIAASGPKARALTAKLDSGWIDGAASVAHASANLALMRTAWTNAGRDEAKLNAVAWAGGAVLEPGEPEDSPRVIAQAGPRAAVMLHRAADQALSGLLNTAPLPPRFQDAAAKYVEMVRGYGPQGAYYLSNHRGHLMFVLSLIHI